MSGAVIKFNAGSVGSAAKNAAYITRQSARDGGLVLHNAPGRVENVPEPETAAGFELQRQHLQSWAERREKKEVRQHGNRKGQPRTHYRVMMSYEKKVETDEAQEDAREWLESEFPNARAAAVVHQDTENTHVHVWMSPRLEDGSKIDISPQDFRDLTAEWDRIYEQRMEEKRLIERREKRLTEKMEEARRFKRKYAKLRDQGASEAELEQWAEENRPDRADPPTPEVYRDRDRRRIGSEELEAAKKRVEKCRERRVEKQLSEAKKVKRKAERRIEQSEKAKESADKPQSKTKNRQEQSHERVEERAGRDERGADRGRQQAQRREQGPFEESERASGRESETRVEADRGSNRRTGGGKEVSRDSDSGQDGNHRNNERSGRSDGHRRDDMAPSERVEPPLDNAGRSRSSGSGVGDSSDHPKDADLSSSQEKILRLLRTIRKAEKDEDVSKEESNLDYKLGTTHSKEIEELREKMSEEQEQALDRFQQQYQERSRGR
jgi:hypothetical protein